MPKEIKLENDKLLKILTRLDFFEYFSKLELQKLLIHDLDFFLFEKGEHIIEKGDSDCAFYIVLDGIVFIVSDSKILAKVNAGDFFGEMAFLTKEPRTANAIAGRDCLIFRVDDHLMDHLHTKVKEKIKDKIIYRLIDNIKQMNELLDSKK